ncbi:hypothetical protein C2S52_007970, partial [Perilla frutescens var. hirtella]
MFPISSDGVFENPSIFFEQDKFLEDLLADCPIPERDEFKSVKKRPRKASPSSEVQENCNDGSGDSKKSAHRVTERQRRQEMAGLYASLRSLLPLEYIKGKRAISDHMHQAVNYINDVKKKIEEMEMRREKLRKMCDVESICVDPNTNFDTNISVKMNVCGDGVEILISSSIVSKSFPLSKILEDLIARKLDVISCVSTRGARCYLHKIQIE